MSTGTVSREIDTDRANPYVGPRSLRREDGIYGRNREIRELRASLIAHRILLLYSHSGAGKTSLIEAGLRPEFEDRGFQVFPTIRVGYDPPPDAGDVNRYLLSTLNSLEEGQQPDEQLDPTELAATSLDEYVRRLDEQIPDTDPLLIFDQFEELFTLDPTDWDDKREFLEEIGRMLEDRGRWALFAMREDFIAQLDPYVALIPTQLATRYRLELLKPAEAVEAIKQPASSVGVDFSDAAAEQLVNDLRRVQVQRGDRPVLELGPSVEPVQLQVVCHRVWAGLPEDVTLIEPDDIADAGTVNEALAAFYETEVRSAADRTKADEYAIRTWFENELITPDGFRTQVREGPNGETDSVVQSLQSSHLIRSDRIRGAEWYELSHDRFVEPIQTSNAAFMRQRRSRRLKLILAAVGTVLAAVILFGLVTLLADSDAPAPTLGRDATAIEFGETVSGEIEGAGDTSVYAFEAGEDETVLVMVAADSNSDLAPELALLDAEEARLAVTAGDALSGEPEILAIPSSSPGRYLITVTGSRGSTGEFELQLSSPDAGELPLDTPVSDSIADEEAVAVYRIEGVAAGDSLVIRLSPEVEFPFAVFQLFGPNGTNLSSGEAFGGGTAELVLEAPLDGAYLVTVNGSGGATGGYEIEQLGTLPIDYDDAVSGAIEQSGDITVFRFDAVAGETSLVTVVASLNPTLNLYDPSGTPVSEAAGFDAEPGEPWLLAAPTSTTGAYHVVVGGLDGSTGEFDITLQQPEVGNLALDQPADGSIGDTTSVGVHQFSASVGDSIVVRIAPEAEFEVARYELFAPGGALLKSGVVAADEWGLMTLEAPEDGAYLVTVGSRFGATGNYEIERLGASSLNIDQTTEGNVGDGDLSAFSFRANGGETMLVTVVAPEVGLNTVVDLYDPEGNYVSTGVGFFDEPGEPWILTAPIFTPGVYHVTVTGSLAEERGPFHITLKRPEVSTLPLGTPVEASIADSIAVGVHRLNASAGDSIALRTTPGGDLATASVSVFGPDGAFVTSQSSSSDGSDPPLIFEALSDGSHLIAVSGHEGSTGGYTVTRLGVRRLTVGQTVEDGLEGSSGVFVYSFDANEGEIPLITLVAPDDDQPLLDLYDSAGSRVSSGVAIEGQPWNLPTPVATSGVHHVTVSTAGAFELEMRLSNWDVASLLPDLPDLVQAEPIDYLQESGGSPATCEEWIPVGLTAEDSVFVSPQYPLAVNHSVWAFAASFDSAGGVASYLDSFGGGCIFPLDPSIRLFPTAELHDGYLWYITTQPDSEGAGELLDSVGVIGRTATDVVELQLVINGFDGFVQEIAIDPNAPYDNPEARELAERLIEPVQTRLSEP